MSRESDSLTGRVAMVTGGASGQGRAMAKAFASAGADLAIGSLLQGNQALVTEDELVHLPRRQELERTVEELEAIGARVFAMDLDVTEDDSVQAFYDATVTTFGKVDILANSAGTTTEQTICDHSDGAWHKVVDVNLNGVYRTIRRVLPGMIKRKWGRIINIASTAASVGAATSGAYCASKAGVVGLTRCVALEGAPHGVTCNAISPTWVETDFGRDWMANIAKGENSSIEDYAAGAKADNPQGRLIQPEEIGALALYLCSEEARGITMQDLTISGGSLW